MNMEGQIRHTPVDGDRRGDAEAKDALRSFGKRLKWLRQRRGMSMAQFAGKVGVSKVTVWNWEHGKSRPRDAAMMAAANALGVAPSQFVMGASFGNDADEATSLSSLVEQYRRDIASIAGVSIDSVQIKVSFG